MGCRCNERSQVLAQAYRAAAQGKIGQAVQRVGVVARTAGADLGQAARDQMRAQAQARLAMLRRR